MSNDDKGFKHNLQGLRVINELETLYENVGLNLTNFTLWGIKNHTESAYNKCKRLLNGRCYLRRVSVSCGKNGKVGVEFYSKYNDLLLQKNSSKEAWSFEGQVVCYSDEIAQRHHDLEDACYMGILEPSEFIDFVNDLYDGYLKPQDKKLLKKAMSNKDNLSLYIPYLSKFIVNFLNRNLIDQSIENLNKFIDDKSIKSKKDFLNKYKTFEIGEVRKLIGYSDEFNKKHKEIKKFLKNRILNSYEAQRMDGKGQFLIKRLFKAYLSNPNQLSDQTLSFVYRIYKNDTDKYPLNSPKEIGDIRNKLGDAKNKSNPEFQKALLRGICDHVAGMTERYALKEFNKLYG